MPSDRPKIAFVIDDLGYGGAQRQLSILVDALSAFVEPRVYCLSAIGHPFAPRIRDAGIPVLEIKRRAHLDVARFHKLYRAFSRDGIDVVHGFLDASNVYSYFAARRVRLPVVLSLRSDRLRLRGVRARVLRHALRKAERVVVNSKAGEHFLTSDVGLQKPQVVFVHNVVEPKPASDAEDLRKRPPTIGFVGRLAREKRIELLVDAFDLLRQRHKGARLIIVGDGEERSRLEVLVRQKALGDAIEMTGTIENVADQINRFSCLALPSAYEGQPNAVLEALALGVPVVASPAGDLVDIVIEGRTGLLFREPKAAVLADALDRLLVDDSIRKRAAVDGPKLVAERFSVDSAVNCLLDVYRALVGRGVNPGFHR